MKTFNGWTICLIGILGLQLVLGSTLTENKPFCLSLNDTDVKNEALKYFGFEMIEIEIILCNNIQTSADVKLAMENLQEFRHSEPQWVFGVGTSNLDVLPKDFLASINVLLLMFERCTSKEFPHGLINSVRDSVRGLGVHSLKLESQVLSIGGFLQNEKLESLVIRHNNIERVENDAFRGLDNLKVLHLDHNGIEKLDDFAFRGLNNLTKLHLDENRIQSLDKIVFHGLTELTQLELGGNEIHNVDKDAFRGLTKLEILYLAHNNLTTLRNGTFNSLGKLTDLFMQGNKFHCDCDLQWLQDWLKDYKYKSDHPECSTPLAGPLKSLKFCDDPCGPATELKKKKKSEILGKMSAYFKELESSIEEFC